MLISIHAPLTGSDLLQPLPEPVRPHFNPRSPYGERPGPPGRRNHPPCISIHAPLTGSDVAQITASSLHTDFNPRSPYGERHCRY